MKRYLALLLSLLMMIPSTGFAISVNGELKNAGLERLSSDPSSPPVFQGKTYWNTTDKKAKIYNGTDWEYLGSGSGSGFYNLITNGDAETPSIPSSYGIYDDGAVAVPINGTGGLPTAIATWQRNTSTPRQGKGDWRLQKLASNAQGEGWAIDFKLAPWMMEQVGTWNLNFDFKSTGAYAAGDVRVYVYDVDAGAMLSNPSFIQCGGGSTPDLASGSCAARLSFTTNVNTSDDYRLIFHVATTNASAWDLYVDNIFVGDGGIVVGSGIGPQTDWPFQAVKGSTTDPTPSNYKAVYFRSGRWLNYDVQIGFSNANKGSGNYYLALPTGLTFDTSAFDSTQYPIFGTAQITLAGTSRAGAMQYDSATGRLTFAFINGTSVVEFADSTDISSSTMFMRAQGRVPIAEWAGGSALGENSSFYISDDGSNDVYGPAGSLVPNQTATTGTTTRSMAIPIGYTCALELNYSGNGWGQSTDLFPYLSGNNSSASNIYGVRGFFSASGTYQVDFGNQGTNVSASNTSGGASSWASQFSGGTRYRVYCSKGGLAVPFGLATATEPGLISPNPQTVWGTKSFNDNVTIGSSTSNSHVINGTVSYVGNDTGSYVSVENATASGTTSTSILRLRYNGMTNPSTGPSNFIRFADSDTATTGTIAAASATTVAYNTSSDGRLKKNVEPISNGIATLKLLRPVSYDWKEDDHHDMGFIAQEVRPVYPYAVMGSPDSDPKESPMQIDYGKMTPILAAAIKELIDKVESLEAEVEQLKAVQ